MAGTLTARTLGPETLAALHAADLPQKDNLCGCFWASIALRAAGIESDGEGPLDLDRVALEAGTVLPDPDPEGSVPPGEPPRVDYRFPLPTAGDGRASGTSAAALAGAI